ncbi:hypothetical protein ACOSQ2_027485 [Xanthoceras sorbifolium]
MGRKRLKAGDVWCAAEHYLANFNSLSSFDAAASPSQVRDHVRMLSWLPPPAGFYKMNVDASVFKGGSQLGVGSIVRNSFDKLVVTAASVFLGGFEVDVAKALAVRNGLRLATS